jgi:hypothetical protein
VYVYVAIALGLIISGFTGGWKVRDWKSAKDDQARTEQTAKETAIRAQRIDTAAVSHEDFKVRASVRERIVVKEVDRVIKEPVYLNECIDDDGLRILASDIAARTLAPSVSASGVPSPASVDLQRR